MERIYLNAFEDGRHLRETLGRYFDWYNQERLHAALGGASPDTRYFVNVKCWYRCVRCIRRWLSMHGHWSLQNAGAIAFMIH
jgi:hypothetical protein